VKNNIKIVVLISIILLLSISFAIINTFINKGETRIDLIEDRIVEVYSKIKLSEFISVKNGKLLNDDYVDTLAVGKKEIKYSYLDNNDNKYEDSFSIEIIDTTKPYVGLSKNYTYVIGSDFNLEKTAFCGDNVTVNPECIIVGNYDLEKVGNYPLIFKATDESGNVAELEFTLNVVEKRNISSSSNKITFEEIKNRLSKNAYLMIDVSKWQEDIDWELVKKSGINYAMLRLGTQKGIDQESIIDSYFDKNIKEAQDVGIKVGVYYFTYANDIEDASAQAEWVIDVLKDYELDLPVAFDWECWNFFDRFDINFYELNMIADTFLSKIKEAGYQPLLYGSKNYIENVWNYLNYDIWLAHYTEKTNYTGEKIMWQFTNVGEVPGIKGKVDVNFYYK